MNEVATLLDRINKRIRNNPVLATLIVLGTVIIALSTLTDATKNLLGTIITESRPAVNGVWEADVSYDWENGEYTEKFSFKGDDTEVYGTASFLGAKRGILEGKTGKNSIQFITKTRVIFGLEEPRMNIHRYRGKVLQDEIRFVMQTEGGFSEHVPIEFTARKVSEE